MVATSTTWLRASEPEALDHRLDVARGSARATTSSTTRSRRSRRRCRSRRLELLELHEEAALADAGVQRVERLHRVALLGRRGRSSRAATCRGRRTTCSSGAPQKRQRRRRSSRRRRHCPDLPRRVARTSHSSSSCWRSRSVSIACQKPCGGRRASWPVARPGARSGSLLPDRVVAVDVVADAGLEHEEAAVDPARRRRRLLAGSRRPRSPSISSAPKRPGGCTAVTVASSPLRAMEGDQRRDVEVGDAVAVGHAERLVADVGQRRA